MGKSVLNGEVVSGDGRMAQAMTVGPRAHFYATYIGRLEPGTLNVRLAEPFTVVPDMVLPAQADGEIVVLQRCQVANLEGFILQSFPGTPQPKPTTLIEVVSAFPLRRFLRLTDGSTVQVSVAGPNAPTGYVKGPQ